MARFAALLQDPAVREALSRLGFKMKDAIAARGPLTE